MIELKLPIQNTLEIIICDLYVKINVSLYPLSAPQSTVGKIYLDQINMCLKQIDYV